MRGLVALLLPALMPSWRFFKTVAPSPRIEFRRITPSGTTDWHESHLRPARVSPGEMVRRLFWNPRWNEYLYLVSCAERVDTDLTPQTIAEIRRRIADTLPPPENEEHIQFRIVFLFREGDRMGMSIDYESDPVLRPEACK